MYWKDVCEEVLEECRKIWFEEPDYTKMSTMGIFPSGAGIDDFVMGNRYNLMCEMQAMSYGVAEPSMYAFLDDPSFTLQQCKDMFIAILQKISLLVGDVHPPECPAPWWNLGLYKKFYEDIVGSFDTVTEKEQLRQLVWLFCGCYSARLCLYLQAGFQWEAAPKRIDMDFMKIAARFLEEKE